MSGRDRAFSVPQAELVRRLVTDYFRDHEPALLEAVGEAFDAVYSQAVLAFAERPADKALFADSAVSGAIFAATLLCRSWAEQGRPEPRLEARLAELTGDPAMIRQLSEQLQEHFLATRTGALGQAPENVRSATRSDAPLRGEEDEPLSRAAADQDPGQEGLDFEQAEDGEDAEYVVFFGTNRRRIDPRDPSRGYSAERSDGNAIDYGRCRVFIPKSHKIGSIGSPWWRRLLAMKDDRLELLGLELQSRAVHWAAVRQQIAAAPPEERQAVLFLHGYNVSFSDACLRAAQIGFDLSVRGAMAAFSWPSQGSLGGYLTDSAAIDASEGAIEAYLSQFATESGTHRVHVIAHSMGNRGLLRAVDRIAERAEKNSGVRFGQIILAAADVDADTFSRLCRAYGNLSERTTLYVSGRDHALEASSWLHDYPRAGLFPPVLVAPGIDTVSVTNVDLTALGHGFVAQTRPVLEDIHTLIHQGKPPGQRFGMRRAATPDGLAFWSLAR